MAQTQVVGPLNVCPSLFANTLMNSLKRGHQPGHEMDDWLQAEREIKHHLNL